MRPARPVVAVPGKDFIERFDRMEYKLDVLHNALTNLIEFLVENGASMNKDIEALAASVVRTTTVQASALQLLQLIVAKLNAALVTADNSGDYAEVRAAVASLGNSTEALAAAVVANTPAEPAPVPVEPAPVEPAPVEPAPVVEPVIEPAPVVEPAPVDPAV